MIHIAMHTNTHIYTYYNICTHTHSLTHTHYAGTAWHFQWILFWSNWVAASPVGVGVGGVPLSGLVYKHSVGFSRVQARKPKHKPCGCLEWVCGGVGLCESQV